MWRAVLAAMLAVMPIQYLVVDVTANCAGAGSRQESGTCLALVPADGEVAACPR
jgi:hypothetical protein